MNIFIRENAFEIIVCEMAAILSRERLVKSKDTNYTYEKNFINNTSDRITGR